MNAWLRGARGVETDVDDFFEEPRRLGTPDTGAGKGGKPTKPRPSLNDVIRGYRHGVRAEAAMLQRLREEDNE
jgi:hypothetical protein